MTPIATQTWNGEPVHSSGDHLNGLRVSIDPASRPDTIYSQGGYSSPPTDALQAQFSPLPAALTVGHLPVGAAHLELDHPRTFSMIYSKYDDASPDAATSSSASSSGAKRKKPLPLPGQPSPLTPKTPKTPRSYPAPSPLNGGAFTSTNSHFASPLSASTMAKDIYGGMQESPERRMSSYQPPEEEPEADPEEEEEETEPPPFQSRMPEPPQLKLDLDFGSGSLFSDLDFGNSSLADSLGSSFGLLSFSSPSLSTFDTFSPRSTSEEPETDDAHLAPTASGSTQPPTQQDANDALSFPPSRKSSIRTVTRPSRDTTPSPSRQLLAPAFIELPPSRPFTPYAPASKAEDLPQEQMTPDQELPPGASRSRMDSTASTDRLDSATTATRSRLDSTASATSQLSVGEVKAASKLASNQASAKTSDVDLPDLKPTKPLFASGRQSLASMNRNRSASVASSNQQLYSGISSHSQSSERLHSENHADTDSTFSGYNSSRNSNLTNLNKELPAPPPSTTQRILRPLHSRPSLPEGRGGSIRKTSASAQAAASSLLNKGKNFMSRSGPAHLESPVGSPTSLADQEGSASRRQPLSRASLASIFNKHSSSYDIRSSNEATNARHSEESSTSGGPQLSPRLPHEARRSSITALYPGQTVMAVKKSFDMLKSPKSRKASNAPQPEEQDLRPQPLVVESRPVEIPREQPKVVEVARTEAPTAPVPSHAPERTRSSLSDQPRRPKGDAEKRPTTEQLLALASAKLAKIAAERKSLTPSTGSTHSDDLSSPSSPISTGASSNDGQSVEAEKYSVAQAIRIKRPEGSSQTHPSGMVPSNSYKDDLAVAANAPPQSPLSPPPPRVAPKLVSRQELTALSVAQPPLSGDSHKAKRSPSLANLQASDSKPISAVTSRSMQFPRSPKPPLPVWQKRTPLIRSNEFGEQLPVTWEQLEDALEQYTKAFQLGQSNRAEIAQNALLPFLKRAEQAQECLALHPAIASRQKEALFSWLDLLSEELRGIPANRGTCLDGVAAILESRLLSADTLADDPDASLRFRDSLVAVLDFAVEKLNEKAVYANTLSFSGRLLAVAFFRIEGVGLRLLRLLPAVKRQDLKRILHEVGIPGFPIPPVRTDIFPEHLHSMCFKDIFSYSALLAPLAPSEGSFLVQSNQHSVRMHGNWLIRWQASDSDLPFAFYRAYHRQLSSFLQPSASDANPEAFQQSWEAIAAPGFLFLAASLLEKIDSLIHRNLRSVTTLGPSNGNFNSQDSANLSMGAKPKVLEHANRRVVSTILDVVGGPARQPQDPDVANFEGLPRRRFFGGMLQVWLRATVKRTSLFDARGVFLLLDFIEGLFYTVCTPLGQQESGVWHPAPDALPMFDNRFILSFIRTIFEKADNTICVMRTVTFLYSQFESFTVRSEDKVEICQKILLHPDIFQRMFLFWNASVRGYYLRLIVWRLSRLGISADGRPMENKDSQTILILQTLNSRLEGIRKRHDEIDPLSDLPDDDLFDSSRCSVDSTRGVQDQPWIIEELREDGHRGTSMEDDWNVEERWHGSQEPAYDSLAAQDDLYDAHRGQQKSGFNKDRQVAVSRMVNWLKVLKAGKKGTRPKAPDSRIQPFSMPKTNSNHTTSTPSQPDEDASPSLNITLSRPASVANASVEAEPTHTVSIAPSRLSMHIDPDALQLQVDEVPTLTETEEQEAKEPFPYLSSPDPDGSTFFKFEFESSMPTAESFEGKRSRRASIKTLDRHSLHNGAMTPSRRPGSSVQASPRVSKRFSKRASILPPPALDLLMESSEPVPQIPKEYQEPPPYDLVQHPYAIRGLREYEDALDEYDVWLARLEENDEDLEGREQGELVPKLTVLWPLSFSED